MGMFSYWLLLHTGSLVTLHFFRSITYIAPFMRSNFKIFMHGFYGSKNFFNAGNQYIVRFIRIYFSPMLCLLIYFFVYSNQA